MSNSNWKKRGQMGWNGRKTAKEISKSKERQFAKKEVKQDMQEHTEGQDYRYPHHAKKNDPESKMKGRVRGIETSIERWENLKDSVGWFKYRHNDHLNWLRSWLEKTKEKLKKVQNKKKL